jgi:hypothetical protein
MEPPLYPPRDWFADPRLAAATPITVERATGRVYGHIALWGTCHTGYPGACVPPPHSTAGYPYFHTGQAECSDGSLVDVGRITMRTGHADLHLAAAAAAAHYDHTGFAAAIVRAGEDGYGIWHAGALLPHVTEFDLAELRRHPPSGDWRIIRGRHELIGTLSVNVPGYPVPRALVAGGQVRTLVAAGAAPLAAIAARRDLAGDLVVLLARVDHGAAMRLLVDRARA